MAGSSSLKRQTLSLYKKILQVGRSWNAVNPNNTEEERKYILNETKHWFLVNRNVQGPQTIKDHLQEAEARLEMGNVLLLSFKIINMSKWYFYSSALQKPLSTTS